jgi:hypothetical protein
MPILNEEISRSLSSLLRHIRSFLQRLLHRKDTLKRQDKGQPMAENEEGLPRYIKTLIVLTVLAALGILFVYSQLPASLVDRNLHKKLTEERERARPISYAGIRQCGECHEEEHAAVKGSYHKDVSCEVCHGPAYAHTQDQSVIPSVTRERKLCPLCHLYDPSRPTGFPQINPVTHNPMQPCVSCHNPHDPTAPETPQECRACHGGIVSMKSLSNHALLSCTTCHDAPEQHKIKPRSYKPSSPTDRKFRAKCHARGSQEPAAPKVDVETHGEKYLCWHCHYAHMPEVR